MKGVECEQCQDRAILVRRCAGYREDTILLKAEIKLLKEEKDELEEKARNAKSRSADELYATIASLKDDITCLTSQLDVSKEECERLRALNRRCLNDLSVARKQFTSAAGELEARDATIECYDRALQILKYKVEEYEKIMSTMSIGEALKFNKKKKKTMKDKT